MVEAPDWVLHKWQKFIGFTIMEKPRTMYDDRGKRDVDSYVMPAHTKGIARCYYHPNAVCLCRRMTAGPSAASWGVELAAV